MPSFYGRCKSKNFLITKDWKCVDFRQPINIPFSEQKRIADKCRELDWFDVCPMCRYFQEVNSAGEPVQVAGKG